MALRDAGAAPRVRRGRRPGSRGASGTHGGRDVPWGRLLRAPDADTLRTTALRAGARGDDGAAARVCGDGWGNSRTRGSSAHRGLAPSRGSGARAGRAANVHSERCRARGRVAQRRVDGRGRTRTRAHRHSGQRSRRLSAASTAGAVCGELPHLRALAQVGDFTRSGGPPPARSQHGDSTIRDEGAPAQTGARGRGEGLSEVPEIAGSCGGPLPGGTKRPSVRPGLGVSSEPGTLRRSRASGAGASWGSRVRDPG